jgi:putative CocE/NonD family hydrolase
VNVACRSLQMRLLLLLVLSAAPVCAQVPNPALDSLFDRREARIPMRDGVHLFTVILTPKRQSGPLPVLMSRTPYGTGGWGGTFHIDVGFRELIADGYVFIFQDIRGQHASEGEFIMNRPSRDRRVATSVDEATDTWDTIDWVLKNVPNTLPRVGMLGISYPGFLVNAAMVEPPGHLEVPLYRLAIVGLIPTWKLGVGSNSVDLQERHQTDRVARWGGQAIDARLRGGARRGRRLCGGKSVSRDQQRPTQSQPYHPHSITLQR